MRSLVTAIWILITVSCGNCIFVLEVSMENEDSVNLTLFYESYCPYSIDFVVNQLNSTFDEFKDYIKLDLLPFGNAQQKYEDGHFIFTCQHGPKECVGNILHACAIHQACGSKGTLGCSPEKVTKVLNYITCVMQQSDQSAASNQCLSQAGLHPIDKCFDGKLGEKLESAYGNRTKAFDHPKVTYVPFIVINDKHTEKEQEEAQDNLRNVICKYIPDQC